MNITEITQKGGKHPNRKRVGRGESSGWGKTAGRGHKGAGQRAGYKAFVLMEGGNFPLFRRIPKHGFNNAEFRIEYQIVNVGDLEERFDARGHVSAAALEKAGLIADSEKLVKILGEGDLKKSLTIEAHRFSASAIAKIEAAGGTIKKIGPQPKKKFIKRPKVVVKKADAEKGDEKDEAKPAKKSGEGKVSKAEKSEARAPKPEKGEHKKGDKKGGE